MPHNPKTLPAVLHTMGARQAAYDKVLRLRLAEGMSPAEAALSAKTVADGLFGLMSSKRNFSKKRRKAK